ncbi:Cof-type HAD-IIB family hydrolase [Rothia sp. AR01]|uniref:Cof-type HAD-IIB family hydrolase n=1 Tax=Rothia santali TaxID=2949643 RepID=A0A9X2HBT3_9MICC|nr:HAD family hydrolase [Rothia santali]MCP3426734.1 Cof-type HAD-IIB family hydrolase [Rothia santali]
MTNEATIQTPARPAWRREPGVKYLVALDVDGTLVDHDGHMTEAVKEALHGVVAAGHHVVVATGRSKGATLPIVELAGLESGWAVSSNGGVTLRLDPALAGGYEISEAVTFRAHAALTTLRDRLPGAMFALEAADGSFYSTAEFQDRSFGMEAQQVSFEELAGMDAVRVVVFSTEVDLDSFSRLVEEVGLHGVTYSVGWTPWLDLSANGVTKASALESVRRLLGVEPEHTVAMGDGNNDVEMLQWAARGVAMGQAPDDVAAAASEVTGTVYEDGAVRILADLAD